MIFDMPTINPIQYSTLSKDELERRSYIEGWVLPNNSSFDSIFKEDYYPENRRKKAAEDDSSTPVRKTDEFISLDKATREAEALIVIIKTLRAELKSVYEEFGGSTEAVDSLLKNTTPLPVKHIVTKILDVK